MHLRQVLVVILAFLSHGPQLVGGAYLRYDLVRPWGGHASDNKVPFVKITKNSSEGLSTIKEDDMFGYSVANVGDLDGDGNDEIAVGAPYADHDVNGTTSRNSGGFYILFMSDDAVTIKKAEYIHGLSLNIPLLLPSGYFGYSLAGMGDMDGDGVPDIAVGAPGVIIGRVYILFMHANGTIRSSRILNGPTVSSLFPSINTGNTTRVPANSSEVPVADEENGPPVQVYMRYGASLSCMGDFNNDGQTDLAIGSVSNNGNGAVYFLMLSSDGTVLDYTIISDQGLNGGPDISTNYAYFGVSVLAMSDLDGDNVTDFAVGASQFTELGSTNENTGQVFILLMNANATVKSYSSISEYSGRKSTPSAIPDIPWVADDACATSLTSIGDINMDDRRQRVPWQYSDKPGRKPIEDLVMGCPQTQRGVDPGRLFFVMLKDDGSSNGVAEIPSSEYDMGEVGKHKHDVGLDLKPHDFLGTSVAGYSDVDNNGMREIVVGAPGDDEYGFETGAIYIFFPRRRRYHRRPFDWLTFWLIICIPGSFLFICVISSCISFFYYFRRKPDPVENIVYGSGIELGKPPPPKKFVRKDSAVHIDYYEE